MRFFGYFRSSAAYRCRIAFNLKGVGYDFVPVPLREGTQRGEAHLRRNPQGLVPTLEVEGMQLGQSLAIVEWLDERYPEPPLLPADRNLRAQVRAFAQAIACDIHPLNNLRVLAYLRDELGQPQEAVDAWIRHWLGTGLLACERLLEREGRHDFAFGEAPTLADICLVPQMFSADRFGVDLGPMPRLRAAREACEALPAFRDAHPSRQPDADA